VAGDRHIHPHTTQGITVTTTIERWVQDWYGLTLHTDRDDFPLYVPTTGMLAAAYAAGFTTALDLTDDILAAQLTSNGRGMIDTSVRLLAAARDLAWQSITAFAADAHKAGLASLPTGVNKTWTPVCVHERDIGPKVYPALANTKRPVPLRFTRKTAERISDDLSGQSGQRISLTFTGAVLTVSHGEHATVRPTQHEPDDDGLYSVGAGSLLWEQVQQVDDGRTTREVEVDRVHPDPAGRYAIGVYLWPWSVVQPGEVTR
jgi:hypothetical protein